MTLPAATCSKCNHDKAYFTEVQTRSADEAATLFFTCVKCGWVTAQQLTTGKCSHTVCVLRCFAARRHGQPECLCGMTDCRNEWRGATLCAHALVWRLVCIASCTTRVQLASACNMNDMARSICRLASLCVLLRRAMTSESPRSLGFAILCRRAVCKGAFMRVSGVVVGSRHCSNHCSSGFISQAGCHFHMHHPAQVEAAYACGSAPAP